MLNYRRKTQERNKHFPDIDDSTICVSFPDTIIYPQTADDDLVFPGSILMRNDFCQIMMKGRIFVGDTSKIIYTILVSIGQLETDDQNVKC